MRWVCSNRFDAEAVLMADRHYNRQKPGTPQFVPPGKNLVLKSHCGKAVWVSSWPLEEFTRHEWAGAWINTLFRNEGAGLSSELIREAVAVTRGRWDVPALGMVTFIDVEKIRRKRDPGRCYRKAGFKHVGFTKVNGLMAFQLLPADMPDAALPNARAPLFEFCA